MSTVADDIWQEPPDQLTLCDGDLHVWHVHPLSNAPAADWALLAEDERAAAARFRFERDRDRYVVCRARLRRILEQYLNQPPHSLRFGYGPFGKPFLCQPAGDSQICFNVSHSHDHGLIAVMRGREVGVDLECMPTDLDPLSLADRFFSEGETAFVRRALPDEQVRAFLVCWTRKEAWMKATGQGLSGPPNRFDVSPSLGKRIAALPGKTPDQNDWLMCELHPASEIVAAVVVRGQWSSTHLWRGGGAGAKKTAD